MKSVVRKKVVLRATVLFFDFVSALVIFSGMSVLLKNLSNPSQSFTIMITIGAIFIGITGLTLSYVRCLIGENRKRFLKIGELGLFSTVLYLLGVSILYLIASTGGNFEIIIRNRYFLIILEVLGTTFIFMSAMGIYVFFTKIFNLLYKKFL